MLNSPQQPIQHEGFVRLRFSGRVFAGVGSFSRFCLTLRLGLRWRIERTFDTARTDERGSSQRSDQTRRFGGIEQSHLTKNTQSEERRNAAQCRRWPEKPSPRNGSSPAPALFPTASARREPFSARSVARFPHS
jgi:hypothetical protein